MPKADRPSLAGTFVAFDYFPAMGIPLVEGRFFRDGELKDDGVGRLVIINEAAAALLFPGRSAVGGRFTVGDKADRVLEVIGVVKDTRDVRLDERPKPRFYLHYAFGGAQVRGPERRPGADADAAVARRRAARRPAGHHPRDQTDDGDRLRDSGRAAVPDVDARDLRGMWHSPSRRSASSASWHVRLRSERRNSASGLRSAPPHVVWRGSC